MRGSQHLCISSKDKWCKKANLFLPAEASKAVNLPQDGRADPGGCSSTQSPITHTAPLQDQRPPGSEREPGHRNEGPYGMEVCNVHRNPASQSPHQSLVLSERRAMILFSSKKQSPCSSSGHFGLACGQGKSILVAQSLPMTLCSFSLACALLSIILNL